MATRSTVTIRAEGRTVCHLYRHWDGGPWGNGAALAAEVRKVERRPLWHVYPEHAACGLASSLLRIDDGHGRPCYQLTSDAAWHGDTEWHYEVSIFGEGENADEPAAIRVRGFRVTDKGRALWAGATLDAFRRGVAAYLRTMRAKNRARLDWGRV